MAKASAARRSDQRRLGRFFNRNAYCRVPDAERIQEGCSNYKKGWEVRLILKDEDEVAIVSSLLYRVGLVPGKAFRKSKRWAVPIYGKRAVLCLKEWGAELLANESPC